MLLKIFLQCMSTNLTFLIPQMRRQSRCCQVSTFVPLAFWLTRTMLSFRDPLHYACWRLVNDVSMSYHLFITLEKLCFIYENILVSWKQKSVPGTCCIWLFKWCIYTKICMSLLNSSYINKFTWKKTLCIPER